MAAIDLLDLTELSKDDAYYLIQLTRELKSRDPAELVRMFPGKSAVLLFEKPSTRTRVSLELAVAGLGATPVVLGASESQLSRGEDLKDTARVLSRYADAITARVYQHSSLEIMAEYADVPVINALSDKHHPLQALADAFTIWEKFKSFDVRVAYVGDGNNVCHSLIIAAALFGFKLSISTPGGYGPDRKVVQKAESISPGCCEFHDDPADAVRGAQVVYTDTWISMGDEDETVARLHAFRGWEVTPELMSKAADGAVFMHCLPAHKGHEVTEEVFESPASIVFEQAENRLHTARALFTFIWKGV